jgi:SAM-dependent methyltransferase
MHGVAVFDENAAEYDRWFGENEALYRAEVAAVRRLVPPAGRGVEVGVGTGRFAAPLGLRIGVEPAWGMGRIAQSRGIAVCQAVGERLPFRDGHFDFVLLVTVICFVPDVPRLLQEAGRVLQPAGRLILAFIDRQSPLGRQYEAHKAADRFFRQARFYSVAEVTALVRSAGFAPGPFCQTVLGLPSESPHAAEVREGYGAGAFVVLSAEKLG